MTRADELIILASVTGIALAVWLIVRLRLHPLVGLLCGAMTIALIGGAGPEAGIEAIEKGFGDILGGTGIVVALGLSLGTILQVGGATQALSEVILARAGRHVALGSIAAAMLLGLPLFFETGVVLLIPIIAAAVPSDRDGGRLRLTAMLSALAGLSALHALLPPHPGPLIAVNTLHASLGKTLAIGLVAAIPTAWISGPLLARYTTRNIAITAREAVEPVQRGAASPVMALVVLLFPVVLIAAGAWGRLYASAVPGGSLMWLAGLGHPALALLLANLLALFALCGRRLRDRELQDRIWRDAIGPSGGILLSIGAGGALKQVLVSVGLPDIFARLGEAGSLSPLLLAWLIAAAIRVATGSATVATITASGVMAGIATHDGVGPEYIVLAIGAGSVFLSHVNDPGFWLVKGYLGTSTADTFRVWTTLETLLSVTGLIVILLLHAAENALG